MNIAQNRIWYDLRALAETHRDKLPYLVAGFVCVLIYSVSHLRDSSVYIYKTERSPDFKDARVLGSQGESIYEGKEKLLTKTMRALLTAQASLRESNEKLQAKFEVLAHEKAPASLTDTAYGPSPLPEVSQVKTLSDTSQGPQTLLAKDPIRVAPVSESFTATQAGVSNMLGTPVVRSRRGFAAPNSGIISFPVKEIAVDKSESVVLPMGSYVKAKLLTGVEAPEGKPYPILLQLDYAFILPNKHKLDLSGCFMIAKSQGNLSTERVEMQATKLSCVSKDGRMFERDINAFSTDDKDNSFGVIGTINSKQDRVASMAFMASVVKGVGSALQQAQSSTQNTSGFGSQTSSTNVTGNQAAYIAGGGAAEAAGQVTQWYLKQAQNLLPTINVGSGQDIWIVMQDSVKLPNDYFRKNTKGASNEGVYSFFSRVLD